MRVRERRAKAPAREQGRPCRVPRRGPSPQGGVRRGFTLVETLVAMVVLALIVAVAVPSYREHTIRARRTDAKLSLLAAAAAQERHFLDANAYAATLAELGVAGFSRQGHYALDVEAVSTVAFVLRATPAINGAQVDDGPFRLDSAGDGTWDHDSDGVYGCTWEDALRYRASC